MLEQLRNVETERLNKILVEITGQQNKGFQHGQWDELVQEEILPVLIC